MRIVRELMPGAVLIETPIHRDSRGFFIESFQKHKFASLGIEADFVQDNISHSMRGTIRGLHFQFPNQQGKLVAVPRGCIYDVIVDVRRGSPRFGAWAAVEIAEEDGHLLWIPPGFAHGFQALSDDTLVIYKVTDYWDSAAERSIRWDDPAIGISWPLGDPILSAKDAAAPRLEDSRSLPA